jgi:hypothetical protein
MNQLPFSEWDHQESGAIYVGCLGAIFCLISLACATPLARLCGRRDRRRDTCGDLVAGADAANI